MNVTITQEDIQKAERKVFDQRFRMKHCMALVKSFNFDRFSRFINEKCGVTYQVCYDQMNEALDVTLPPKKKQEVLEQFDRIRGWEGVNTVVVDWSEFDLYDLMQVVHTEMTRAATIHGADFRDYAEAKEAIAEEIEEVWEAAERGDMHHAKTEAIQAIGTLIKFIRSVR